MDEPVSSFCLTVCQHASSDPPISVTSSRASHWPEHAPGPKTESRCGNGDNNVERVLQQGGTFLNRPPDVGHYKQAKHRAGGYDISLHRFSSWLETVRESAR